jgi:hypothetical protein
VRPWFAVDCLVSHKSSRYRLENVAESGAGIDPVAGHGEVSLPDARAQRVIVECSGRVPALKTPSLLSFFSGRNGFDLRARKVLRPSLAAVPACRRRSFQSPACHWAPVGAAVAGNDRILTASVNSPALPSVPTDSLKSYLKHRESR